VTKARVERADAKGLTVVDFVAEGFDGGALDDTWGLLRSEKLWLLRVQLDDELLLDRFVDLFALGYDANRDRKVVVALLEPARDRAVQDVEVALDR